MIELGDERFDVVLDSGVLGMNGLGWPPELLAILLGRLQPRELAAISKTISYDPITGNYRWWKPWETVRYLGKGTWVNAYGLSNRGVKAHLDELQLFCGRVGVPIISFLPPKPEDAGRLGWELSKLKPLLAALEANISCPNIVHLALDDQLASIKEIRRVCRLPVILKLAFGQPIQRITEMFAGVCEAIHVTNTVPWDLVFPGQRSPMKRFGGGGVSGPTIFPHTESIVHELRQSGYTGPIIAGGGVTSVERALELRDLGADAIAVGTAVHHNPGLPHMIKRAL